MCQPGVFLPASFHCQKNKSKGSHIRKIWTTFFLPHLQRRKAFLAGLVLTVMFWIVSSMFVWDIQISGNCVITDDMIFQFLEQEGIQMGMRKSKLDIGELEKQIRRQFPQVTWTSGRLMGTRLLLELKENDAPIPEDTQGADAIIGRDLVAEYDGVITDMIVRSGIPQVTIGSQVAKGDLLVDGKVPIYAEDGTIREYRMVIADADIRMEHSGHFRIFLPADYILKKYTGREKQDILCVWVTENGNRLERFRFCNMTVF